ncbi:MAG TPA: hypothetical protein VMV10_11485, partial [Pirellulales bacterium]|nr:hypothetical protein [Pirellulales bacterium]
MLQRYFESWLAELELRFSRHSRANKSGVGEVQKTVACRRVERGRPDTAEELFYLAQAFMPGNSFMALVFPDWRLAGRVAARE